MKKTLLIATTLMALALPAHAAQINQSTQNDQAKMSQQAQPDQGTTNIAKCIMTPQGKRCAP